MANSKAGEDRRDLQEAIGILGKKYETGDSLVRHRENQTYGTEEWS